MNEPKTFDELSLRDIIHWANDEHHSYDSIIKIEMDPDDNNKTLIELYQSDPISFPNGESIYEDKDSGTKYTTDIKKYQEWIIPFTEAKIAAKEKKIEEIKLEIEELRKTIPKKES